jgi:hypothetical protein
MKHLLNFIRRFTVWVGSMGIVLLLVVFTSHMAQIYLGWSPEHTVEISLKLAIGSVAFVSWLVPSPFHRRHLYVEDLLKYAHRHGNDIHIKIDAHTHEPTKLAS